ncbi:MAG: N-acetyl-gamma-glutamyl-phosphate reductase [Acidobacteria bacterium]|nr:N-acetyl-gamma-glutamyl-phosphate reductase [Acidobacteriota bacterium]
MASLAKMTVGIAGVTGYAGRELLRLLAGHPHVEIASAMASSQSGERSLPGLRRLWDGEVTPFDLDELASRDAVFLALPEEAAAKTVPCLVSRRVRVLDLSGAFRLKDHALRTKWYPHTPDLPVDPVYGLTELQRASLPSAAVVACPGCYPTAALLALAPLARAGLLDGDIVIDAKSGISGAGKSPSERTHFSECHDSISAYGIFGHRHAPEIEQSLGAAVTFVPHLVPLNRGIFETIYARLTRGTSAEQIAEAMAGAYRDAPFVRLLDALPELKYVVNTNFCDIGWRLDQAQASSRIVMVSCLDNLVKGAAGQAVQNFNLMFGIDERAGLLP